MEAQGGSELLGPLLTTYRGDGWNLWPKPTPGPRRDTTAIKFDSTECSCYVLMADMTRDTIREAIQMAPAWAKLGLSMRDEHLRERAADTLAATIAERLERPVRMVDANQMVLPL